MSGRNPSDLGEPQTALLNAVYREFVRTGDWPQSWRLERDMEDLLEPAGGLAEVCKSLSDLVICEPITQNDSRVKLRLRAFTFIERAAIDVSAFLTLCRFAARTYRNSDTQPVQVTLDEFIAFSGIDEALARRAFQMALLDGHFWSSGSAASFQLDHFARKLGNVNTIEELEKAWNDHWNRHYHPVSMNGAVPAQSPPVGARYFLSHTAFDSAAAQYIANLIRTADTHATVFVASIPGHIHTGDDWLASIRTELRAADVYIVLLSERSVTRPWIWFEAGAAWFSERRLIPLVLPGLAKSDIPMPLAAHQTLSLDSERETEQFFADLGLATPSPSAVVSGIRDLCRISGRNENSGPSIDVAAT